MKLRSSRILSATRAFSLVEVVIALGIFAFAIVGLLALFPVAIESARTSREETLVVNIARMVMADIKVSPFDKARVVVKRQPDGTDEDVETMNLATSGTTEFYYQLVEDPTTRIERWNPVGRTNQVATPNPPPDFVVSVQTAPVVATSGTAPPKLSHVIVTVESPASAPSSARRRYPFSVLISESR